MALKPTIIFFISAFIFFITSCTSHNKEDKKANSTFISGKVNFPPAEGGTIILEEINYATLNPVDTITLDPDSSFAFTKTDSLFGYYRLNFFDKQYVLIALNTDSLSIHVDGNQQNGFVKISGSEETAALHKINRLMQDYQNKANQLHIDASLKEDNKAFLQDYQEQAIKLYYSNQELLKEKILAMDNTPLTMMYAARQLNLEENISFVDSLLNILQKEIPQSKYLNSFINEVNKVKRLAIGQIAPEIKLPNPDGKTVSLSDFRGKYVLIDFWASWCGPCRKESPHLVSLYNEYQSEKFEILGVSLDRNRKDWLEAVKKDQLSWIHVSDLKAGDSEALLKYEIKAIPTTFLVDPEGKIIAKNLRGESLSNKLSEIFKVDK